MRVHGESPLDVQEDAQTAGQGTGVLCVLCSRLRDASVEWGENIYLGCTVKNEVNTPIKANAPGRQNSQRTCKNGANAPGRSFRVFSRGRSSGASPRHEKVCEKDLLRAVDGSQHAVGGIARAFFFLFIFIHQLMLFFNNFSGSIISGLNMTRLTFFFLETPRGAPSALFLF